LISCFRSAYTRRACTRKRKIAVSDESCSITTNTLIEYNTIIIGRSLYVMLNALAAQAAAVRIGRPLRPSPINKAELIFEYTSTSPFDLYQSTYERRASRARSLCHASRRRVTYRRLAKKALRSTVQTGLRHERHCTAMPNDDDDSWNTIRLTKGMKCYSGGTCALPRQHLPRERRERSYCTMASRCVGWSV